jgi:hypothetical protein
MKRLLGVLTLLLLVLLSALPVSFGWGNNTRRLITDKAVDTLPDEMLPFFQANRAYLIQHTNEVAEAETKLLAPARNNFIELDHYGAFPFATLPRVYSDAVAKYGKRSLAAHGQLPWEIGVYSEKLTNAFRSHAWDEVKLDAATLSYYVAAAHDPFKSTKDNDGKLAGQPGVNERFGIGLVDHYQRFFFMKPNEAAFVRDPTDYAFEMTLSAHSWLENILLADRRAYAGLSAYNDDYYDRFYAQAGAVLIRQLTDASTDTGSYWMTAWINAGRPQLPSN